MSRVTITIEGVGPDADVATEELGAWVAWQLAEAGFGSSTLRLADMVARFDQVPALRAIGAHQLRELIGARHIEMSLAGAEPDAPEISGVVIGPDSCRRTDFIDGLADVLGLDLVDIVSTWYDERTDRRRLVMGLHRVGPRGVTYAYLPESEMRRALVGRGETTISLVPTAIPRGIYTARDVTAGGRGVRGVPHVRVSRGDGTDCFARVHSAWLILDRVWLWTLRGFITADQVRKHKGI